MVQLNSEINCMKEDTLPGVTTAVCGLRGGPVQSGSLLQVSIVV